VQTIEILKSRSLLVFAFLSINRCLFYSSVAASDQSPGPTDDQLSDVFQKDLVVNVFRNGAFGSFRHLLLLGPSGCFLLLLTCLSCLTIYLR